MKQIIYKLLFIPAVLAIALVITFAPDSASAQGFVPCSGSECNFCHFVELGNTVITWLIGILSLVFGVMVFIAGFGLVTSGGNDSKLTDAKKSLTNALIGLVIVLAAWLIVDTLIKLTLPEGETAIGPWNEISCEGGQKAGSARASNASRNQICPVQFASGLQPPANCTSCAPSSVDGQSSQNVCQCKSALPAGQQPGEGCRVEAAPTGGVSGAKTAQCSSSNTACNVAALKLFGLTDAQANVMSCIAMTESSGNASTPPYNETNPNARPISTACGTFQITQTTWNSYSSGLASTYSACTDWRSNCQNATCNAALMSVLVKRRGYRDWLCPTCNNDAQGCVDAYGG